MFSSKCIRKKYASVCPNLVQGNCLVLAGQNIPQRTLSLCTHPADCFTELQKALLALALVNYNDAISRDEYYRSPTATGLMIAYNTTLTNLETTPHQFVMGINTEIVSH